MTNSPNDHFSRIEARIEQWMESTFAAAFGPRIDVFDIALHIARAMDAGVTLAPGTNRPTAPDIYRVVLHDAAYQRLHHREAEVIEKLASYVVTLAAQKEYRLTRQPIVTLTPDPQCEPHHPRVHTSHTDEPGSSTTGLEPIQVPSPVAAIRAHLLVNGTRACPLVAPLVNIGRMEDNDIVIDDPHVSRHHLQLRQRGTETLLFDVGSSRGTRVNGRTVREHRLRSGDLIEIGKTRLIYIEDRDDDHTFPPTETLDAV